MSAAGEGQIGEPPTKSIPSERVTEGDVGEYDVIHYGEKVGEGGAAPSPLVGAGREGQLAPSGPTHAGLSSSHPSRAEGVSRERSQVSAAARSAGGGKTSGSEVSLQGQRSVSRVRGQSSGSEVSLRSQRSFYRARYQRSVFRVRGQSSGSEISLRGQRSVCRVRYQRSVSRVRDQSPGS